MTLVEICPSDSAMYRFVVKNVCYPEKLKKPSLKTKSVRTSETHLFNRKFRYFFFKLRRTSVKRKVTGIISPGELIRVGDEY